MKHEKAIGIIRKEFSHVDVEKIVVKHDPSVGCEVAKVFVRSDQLAAAYRKNGAHAKHAAMRSGLSVEIEVTDPKPKLKKRQANRKRGGGPVGRFILHRFCGDEEYAIKTAEMRAIREEKGVRLWFEAETEGVRLKSLPDTAELNAWPKAEVGVWLKGLDPRKLVGRKFNVMSAYDEKEESHVATIYYVEHEELWRNRVEIVHQEGDVFVVHWTGVTTDVNYHDGSKPRTKVEIEGSFTFIDMEQWTQADRRRTGR